MGLNKGGNMGLLDFIFGKEPGWGKVSKDTFSTEDTYIYSKAESKKLLKLYLGKLGFSKKDIRDEVKLYSEGMQDEESFVLADGLKLNANESIQPFTTGIQELSSHTAFTS